MKKKKAIVTVTALAAAFILLVAGYLTGSYDNMIGERYADVTDYFGELADNEYAIVFQDGSQAEERAVTFDGEEGYFLPWEDAFTLFDSPIYIDTEAGVGLVARSKRIWTYTPGEKGYVTDEGKHKKTDLTVVLHKGATWYVNIAYLPEIMDIYMDTDHPEAHSLLVITDQTAVKAPAAESSEEGGIKVHTTDTKRSALYKKADEVYVLEEGESWSKVMTPEGYIGYAQNEEMGQSEVFTFEGNAPEYANLTHQGTICLGWHQVAERGGNATLTERMETAQGMTIISPTWFSVTDEEGNISSFASSDYVEEAHAKGLKVWGLIDNFTNTIDDKAFMSSTTARQNMISQLMEEAKACGMDGVNLDFESIRESEAIDYTQLVRELSIACRREGLIFSVDDPVPTYSAYYNRDVQGAVADYVIVMGYDENYAGSEQAGSNASLSFVEKGLKDTLKEVDASKVISAMPFYTRLWIESYDNGSLECQTLAMTDANAYAKEQNMKTYWDAEAGQNIAELDTEENLQRMWLEDEQSLEEKLKLIDSYELAGGAFWKLGFEEADIWTLIRKYLP